MTHSPNIPLEMVRGLLVAAGWWILFYVRHRPTSKFRRVLLPACFPVCYTVWRILSVTGTNNTNQLNWVIIIILFALICGDLRESLFTAIYYIGIEVCMDTIRNFSVRYIYGKSFPMFSIPYYVTFCLLYLVVLGWAVFYYWILKDLKGKIPLRFWIITVLPPLCSAVLLTRFANMAAPLLETGINIYSEALITGFFLLTLNLFTFYIYVRLLVYYESHLQAQILQGRVDVYAHQIKSIEAGHERTQAVRHEMKNLLLVLQSAITEQNYAEAQKRLSAVLGELETGTVKSYTGFNVIDAMLSYKTERLQASGAALAVHASLLAIPADTTCDIAAMLAIMLDNAADAAGSGSVPPPFPIRCEIQQKNNIVLLTLSNPLPAPLCYHNGEIVSTKTESGHGLGLPSLRRIAAQYEGDIQITGTEGVFTITVMLFVQTGIRA